MKKVIELLEKILKLSGMIDAPAIEKWALTAIAELQNPMPITPEQYREIEGKEYPENGAVYALVSDPMPKWVATAYGVIKHMVEDHGWVNVIVCAYNLKRPPSVDWRPK
jgi:hypothetical protein